MKKYMFLLLAVVLMLTTAVCFAQSPADLADLKALDASLTEDIHIEFWGKDSISDSATSRGRAFAEFAEEYSQQFEHVTFEYIHQGGWEDLRGKVIAASVANELPAAWMAEESNVKSFQAIAADLTQWVPSEVVADFNDGLMSSSMYSDDGILIAAPAARSNPIMFVNNEVLAEAGWTGDMIKTNDDMFQCAKDIYEKTGKPGMAVWWDTDLWHWESAVYADGGQVLTDDGSKPSFGKDYDYVGAKYVLRIQEALKEGYAVSFYSAPKPYDEVTRALTTGEIGLALISSNSMKARFNAAAENGYTLSTYVQPAGEGGIHVTGGGSNWVMAENKSETEKLFAGGFIAYLSSVDKVIERTNRTGDQMVTKSALNSEQGQQMLAEFPGYKAIYESIPYLHARPNTPYWAEMYNYGADKLAQFSLNYEETDVYAMIDDMEAKFQQIIDDNAW